MKTPIRSWVAGAVTGPSKNGAGEPLQGVAVVTVVGSARQTIPVAACTGLTFEGIANTAIASSIGKVRNNNRLFIR